MSPQQALMATILALMLAGFLWGRWRHDVVALAALLVCVLAGLVAPSEAFSGFGHPAVITVACVLILSAGLQQSGAVEILSRALLPRGGGVVANLLALTGLGAVLSGFMNNVGAMALLMPVAVQMAGRLGLAPGQVLMPLAFGTILGGMTTLIGTPPNLIVAEFRAEAGPAPFGMFDFAPVGLAVAAGGVALIALFGWRLVPARRPAGDEDFETGLYMTEVRVGPGSRAEGMTLRAFEDEIAETSAQVLALLREGQRHDAPHGGRRLRAGDILVLEADPAGLAQALARMGLVLEEQGSSNPERVPDSVAEPDEDPVVLREMVVRTGSPLIGRTARGLKLRSRHRLNLLAVAREGRRARARLRTLPLKAGDLLLLQGPAERLADFAADHALLPLAGRNLSLPDRRRALAAVLVLAAAVLVVAGGLLPAAPAFALAVLAALATGVVATDRLYAAIDWPVIVLLGALIPVASAVEATGIAEMVARLLVGTLARGDPLIALMAVIVVTMVLSDLMNNAATAAVMCPIALGVAQALGVSADSFLMAVAIGASCAFLTPIGHQNNTLILGPGGFGFGDYWRLGLPLQGLILVLCLVLLPRVWPL